MATIEEQLRVNGDKKKNGKGGDVLVEMKNLKKDLPGYEFIFPMEIVKGIPKAALSKHEQTISELINAANAEKDAPLTRYEINLLALEYLEKNTKAKKLTEAWRNYSAKEEAQPKGENPIIIEEKKDPPVVSKKPEPAPEFTVISPDDMQIGNEFVNKKDGSYLKIIERPLDEKGDKRVIISLSGNASKDENGEEKIDKGAGEKEIGLAEFQKLIKDYRLAERSDEEKDGLNYMEKFKLGGIFLNEKGNVLEMANYNRGKHKEGMVFEAGKVKLWIDGELRQVSLKEAEDLIEKEGYKKKGKNECKRIFRKEFGEDGTKWKNEKGEEIEVVGFSTKEADNGTIFSFHILKVGEGRGILTPEKLKKMLEEGGYKKVEKEETVEAAVETPEEKEAIIAEEAGEKEVKKETLELSEDERRYVEAYFNYSKIYLSEAEEYYSEENGYSRENIPNMLKGVMDQFWAKKIFDKISKDKRIKKENIEKAVEMIKQEFEK